MIEHRRKASPTKARRKWAWATFAAALASTAAAGERSVVLAQAPDPFSGFDTSADSGSTQFWIRLIVCVAAAVLAFAFSFYYVFPRLLQKPDPDWPRTAFGKAAGLVWLLASLAALVCFWPELKLPSESELALPMSLVYEYGLRAGVAVVALLGGVFVSYIYRSDHEKVAS